MTACRRKSPSTCWNQEGAAVGVKGGRFRSGVAVVAAGASSAAMSVSVIVGQEAGILRRSGQQGEGQGSMAVVRRQAGVVRRQAALNSGVTNVRMQQIRQAGTVQDTLLVNSSKL